MNYKTQIINIVWLFAIAYFATSLFNYFGGGKEVVVDPNGSGNIVSWNNNTWAVNVVLTWDLWSWDTNTWTVIVEVPSDPRGYIDYVIKQWLSYISIDPVIPPIIRSSNKADNNAVMRNYVSTNSVQFNMGKRKTGYVMFTTKREIPDNKDFFLAINGKIVWHIRKTDSLDVRNENEYIYSIQSIPLVEGAKKDLYDSVKSDWSLIMTAFVGEKGNYVQNITIVFK